MNQVELLQHYSEAVERVLLRHNFDARVVGGRLSLARGGRVTIKARLDSFQLVARHLASVLGVDSCRIYLEVEVRGGDNGVSKMRILGGGLDET